MPCCHGQLPNDTTALEDFAQSLRLADVCQTAEFKFPMYAVPLQAALAMTELKPHEQLLAEDILTVYDQSAGKAMFVSHQWIGGTHPDPDFQQFRVLQDALINIMNGKCNIIVSLNTEVRFGTSDKPSAKDFTSEPLFLWYDYFCCPQQSSAEDLQNAIDSIPAYVEHCAFFVALCPTVETFSDVYNYFTWAARGWCRVEQVARDLSDRENAAILMVPNARQPEVSRLLSISISSPGEGAFSLPHDRARVAPMLQDKFVRKLRSYLVKGDLVKYRLLLNQERMLFRGLPIEALGDFVPGFIQSRDDLEPKFLAMERFLHCNGFRQILERDAGGFTPLCYAAINGDAQVVEALLEMKANPNDRITKGVLSLSLPKNLYVACLPTRFKNHEALKLLINARANINAGSGVILDTPLSAAAFTDDVEGIRLLLDARADPHIKDKFNSTALTFAASGNSVGAIEELLLRVRDIEICTLQNPDIRNVEVAERLILANADVNEIMKPRPLPALVLGIMRTKHRLSSEKTQLSTHAYWCHKSPPLFAHLASGRWEVAAALIRAGARLDLKHPSGKTAADVATENGAPDYIIEALQGDVARCDSVVSKIITARPDSNKGPLGTFHGLLRTKSPEDEVVINTLSAAENHFTI